MGDSSTTTATPPAQSGGLTKDDVLGIVKGALEEFSKPLNATLEKLSAAVTPAAAAPKAEETAGKAKPLTAEDVTNLVQDSLKSFSNQQQQTQVRDSYAKTKMSDLPATYQALLPNTSDPAELKKAEQDIRDRFKAEVGDKIAAAQTQPLNSNGGGQAAQGKVDVSKLSPTQKIAYALSAGTVATSGQSAASAAAAAAAAAASK